MAKKRTRNNETPPLRFDQKLVLNQFMLSLFEVKSFEKLAEHLTSLELEGLDENNVHKFLHQLRLLWEFKAFPGDTLLGYDQNIVKHTLAVSEHRAEPIRWKYFQYLSLLFTEIFLDRFFRDPAQLLRDLNVHLAAFNADRPKKERLPEYEEADLRKLAFWNATGSGKTLLMHVNILQYRHYLKMHGREKELNRIILLTPNEGLSDQHFSEFRASGIDAEKFSKESPSLFAGKSVEIIEITKLKEEMGQKTVAIDAFESNNLVLVDEGHRGASGSGQSAHGKTQGAWMSARNRLCEHGFSFEYSATFGQAMKGKKGLEEIYAKNILFDYSYKYFYRDGFGKDYRILNLADDSDEERRRMYLTACLVAFYQQQKLFADNPSAFRPFLLEKPLWVFVGGSVNAVRTQNKRKVSDVIDILLTLAEFVKNKRDTIDLLKRLLGGKPGLLDQAGNEIFAGGFPHLIAAKLTPEQLYEDILRVLFNSQTQAALHVENLKGADGEIALRLGDNEPFGVINVGDASSLCKLCEDHPELLVVTEKEFAGSLFRELNESDSTVNVLIGSKKFTEGWNSWRVSTMGLMNIGRSEGSEIIQLFGRGLRLKGYGMTLKRSSGLDGIDRPKHIKLIEMLNIFGIRADYMKQFKEYLEEEGLPGNKQRIEIVLPTIKNLNGKKLTSKQEGKLAETQLAFMDMDKVWFKLQQFKNERSWHNLSLPREGLRSLLLDGRWYRLFIPADELKFTNFDRVRRWEEIAVALLKKYIDRFYKHAKQEWESEFYEYHELTEDDPNFLNEYRLMIEDKQYVTFVDPKGIRNLEGTDDPKIRFHRTIKELEAKLADPDVILNSFIISNTPFQQVRWWAEELSKDQFTAAHVLFQKEDRATYIKRMLTTTVDAHVSD